MIHDTRLPPVFDAVLFDAELTQGAPRVKYFRNALQQGQQAIKAHFLAGESAATLVHQRAWLVDQLLVRAWREFQCDRCGDLALVAVGGYGRGELHPGSDIDIMVLLPDAFPDAHRAQIEPLVTFMWDIGLEVGHSVRSLAECVTEAGRDITIATNLMEARLLSGPAPLFEEMLARTGPAQLWPSRQFFEAKWREQIARHHKYHDTAYNLEPNVKEGPGGLRDIQMIGWVAKRHFGARTLHDLVGHQFLTEAEYQSLIEGQNFLWKVRFALHTLAGRREDRVLFDYQRALAQQFGYHDDAHRLAVEQLMKAYYRTIMELSRLNEMLLQLFQEAILHADAPAEIVPLNKRFQACNGFIEVVSAATFQRYPFALLEIFLLLQQHPELQGVRASTIRLIRDHRYLIDAAFRNDLRNRSLFMEVMRQPRGICHELRRMNRYGVLAAYLPMFGAVVGQMQYDLFHVYTVDEHSLMVLRNARRFTVAEFAQELPHCSALVQRLPKLEILWLAALFHDIAKGRGGDHSALGEEEAMRFCLHHGMSSYDARFVAWLVRWHLIFSSTAQRKDISDPEVIAKFAAQVGDIAHLNYLYLLTVADIRGTNPTLWNSWKGTLLWELYTATARALRRGLENSIDMAELLGEVKQRALALLATTFTDHAVIEQLWCDMPDDYFLRHSADEIAWHAQAILAQHGITLPLILVRQVSPRGGTEIFLYTHEHEYLFATVTRALDQLGLTILDARIITSRSGMTLDTYAVLEAGGSPINSVDRINEIVATLRRDIAQPLANQPLVNRRAARQLKHFKTPTEINFDTDERNNRTVMEVITADRPGLLSRIARAFAECGVNLQNAKVSTLGERAEDVFFITDPHGQPLRDPVQLDTLRLAVGRYLEDAK